MQDGKDYILIDVPDENFTDDHGKPCSAMMAGAMCYRFGKCLLNSTLFLGAGWNAVATLEQTIPLQSLRRIVVTHLTPKRLPSLRALLQWKQAAGGALDVHLSNPALQLLRSSLGDHLPHCMPLQHPQILMYKRGQKIPQPNGVLDGWHGMHVYAIHQHQRTAISAVHC